LKSGLKKGAVHPKEAKINLAKEIVARFHGNDAAIKASAEFDKVFKSKGIPEDIEEKTLTIPTQDIGIIDLLKTTALALSTSEARRLIQQGGVSIDGQRVSDINHKLVANRDYLLQVGKRKFAKIYIKTKCGQE